MKLLPTELEGVFVIEPRVFEDPRGFFMETFHRERYEALGLHADFCQDNLSFSSKNTLRGLHYQFPHAQAKLVQVLQGEIFDVAVDIRRGSPTFGRAVGVSLSESNRRQLFIPRASPTAFACSARRLCLPTSAAIFMRPTATGACSGPIRPWVSRGRSKIRCFRPRTRGCRFSRISRRKSCRYIKEGAGCKVQGARGIRKSRSRWL